MKKYITVILLIAVIVIKAQIAFGKPSVTNDAVSIEFGTGFKGLILPYVLNATSMSNAVEGTIVFDVNTLKMRYNYGKNLWRDLSLDEVVDFTYNGTTIPSTKGAVDNSIQSNLISKVTSPAATIIGSNPDADVNTPGVLVLSDTNKAMILPKMDSPHLNIINPAPGLMVYDTKMNQLAVFNGTVWTFWKP